MNFKGMGKKQQQQIALGGIVAVALVVGTVFAGRISLSSIGKAKQDLEDLLGKIKSADRALAKQGQVRNEFVETMDVIKGHLRDVPPNQNHYAWVTKIIRAKARSVNLEIDTIDKQSRPKGSPSAGKGATLKLESYSLRIVARGGYEALKQFLELVEKDHLLARVVTVDLSTGKDPEIHNVQLVVQWPFNLAGVADAWPDVDMWQRQDAGGSGPEKGSSPKKMPASPSPRPEPIDPEPHSSKEQSNEK